MILCADRIGAGEHHGRGLFAGPSGSGDGGGGLRVGRVFGRAAVSGQRVVHRQGARPAARDRRCEGPQVGRGPKPKLAAYDEALRAQVAQKGDITLIELQAWLAGDHAVKVSVGCLWARVRHLGLTLKKSRNAPQSRIVPT